MISAGKAASSGRRGRCRYCGRTFALTKAGLVRSHLIRGRGIPCGGGGQIPS